MGLNLINVLVQEKMSGIGSGEQEKMPGIGSGEDFCNGTSHKTSGGLKNDLLINKLGCIISKKKFILEKQYNRLHDVNMRKKANARDNQDNK
jgi:hypothetical protein